MIDTEEIWGWIIIVLLAAAIVFLPLLAGYMLWLVLAPVGFWQIIVALIVEIVVLIILYGAEFAILGILGVLLS